MRKLNVAILALFFGLSFASCKTEYTCECNSGDKFTKKHDSKSDAEQWCSKKEVQTLSSCTVSES